MLSSGTDERPSTSTASVSTSWKAGLTMPVRSMAWFDGQVWTNITQKMQMTRATAMPRDTAPGTRFDACAATLWFV